MMRKALPVFCLIVATTLTSCPNFFGPVSLLVDKDVSNGTWTADLSYIIAGNVTLSYMTIEPGVTVYIRPGCSLKFFDLSAEGSPGKRITFTSSNDDGTGTPAAGDWGSIVPTDYSTYSDTFAYCDFRYATAALKINPYTTVDYCTFYDNTVGLDASIVVPASWWGHITNNTFGRNVDSYLGDPSLYDAGDGNIGLNRTSVR